MGVGQKRRQELSNGGLIGTRIPLNQVKGPAGKPPDRTSSTPVVALDSQLPRGRNWFTHVWLLRACRGSAHHPNRRPQRQEE